MNEEIKAMLEQLFDNIIECDETQRRIDEVNWYAEHFNLN
jgi:hypothetical protein